MQGWQDSSFGDSQAKQILKAGWRQGAPFRPPDNIPISAPYDRETEWLVVCTQSCSVVSPNLQASPTIEVIVAKPIPSFSKNAPEAKGRPVRRFHLPVFGISGVEALDCDINRRFTLPREAFLQFTPQPGATVSSTDARNLAGWIARYYTRIALPNELVRRATQKNGLFKIIENTIKRVKEDNQPLHVEIDGIYLTWDPDEELDTEPSESSNLYRLDIIFLCRSSQAEEQLGRILETQLNAFTSDNGQNGIHVIWDTKLTSTTFISDLQAYSRLSEWDYFSNLGDVAESYEQLSP